MINYDLPTTVIIDGEEYPINQGGDYRMVLDIIEVMNADDITDRERGFCALNIFYDFNIPKNIDKAVEELKKFINCGEEKEDKDDRPPLMSWQKDFPLIVTPINKVIGNEIRSMPYLHWWTFLGAYMEIDKDCQFSQIVGIRSKKQKGKSLDKSELEYYRQNKSKIDLPIKYTSQEKQFLKDIFGEEV